MIKCSDSGLVYTNPRPYLKAINAWHPSIVQLGGGRLLCAFDLGQAAVSMDYRTYLSRSDNGGTTWSQPTRLFEEETSPPSTHTARISRLRDGRLVAFGARFHRSNPEVGLTNRETLGFVPLDLILLRSDDEGATWQGPTNIAPPLVGPAFEVCHSILPLKDGRWLAPTQTWPGWDGTSPAGMKAIALVSHDEGATWPEFISTLGGDARTSHFEQSVIQLSDGRLLATAWAYDKESHGTGPTPYAVSRDGVTFGDARLNGLHGQTAKLLALSDNRFLCVYRREDKPGLWAQLACLDGDLWVNLDEIPLWQGATDSRANVASTSDQLSGLRFGFPSLIRTSDDEAMVVFWCEEGGVHNIRWFRLALSMHREDGAAEAVRSRRDGVTA